MERFFSPAFKFYLFCVKNTYQKAANLTFRLISRAEFGSSVVLGVKYKQSIHSLLLIVIKIYSLNFDDKILQ